MEPTPPAHLAQPAGRRMSESETKRFNHNALERKRRIIQKDRLQDLRELVPDVTSDKPSTMEVLQKASAYIRRLHQQVSVNTTEMDTLIYRNTDLMSRLATLTKSRNLPWPEGQPQYTPTDIPDSGHHPTHTSSANRILQPMKAHTTHFTVTPAAPPSSLNYSSSGSVNSMSANVANGIVPNGDFSAHPQTQGVTSVTTQTNGVSPTPAPQTHTHRAPAPAPSSYPAASSENSNHLNNPANSNASTNAVPKKSEQQQQHQPQQQYPVTAPPNGASAGDTKTNPTPANGTASINNNQSNGVNGNNGAPQSVQSASPKVETYMRPVYLSRTTSTTETADQNRARTSMAIKTEFTKPSYTGRRDSTSSGHSVSSSLPNIGPRKRSVHVAESNNYNIEPRLRKISRSEVGDDKDDDLEADAALLTELHNGGSNSVFNMDMEGDRKTSPDSQPCKCGKPWDGKPMVMCEECQRWLHGVSVPCV